MIGYALLRESNRRALDRAGAHRAEGSVEIVMSLDISQLRDRLRYMRWETFVHEQRAIAQAGLLDKVAEVERRLFGDPWDRP